MSLAIYHSSSSTPYLFKLACCILFHFYDILIPTAPRPKRQTGQEVAYQSAKRDREPQDINIILRSGGNYSHYAHVRMVYLLFFCVNGIFVILIHPPPSINTQKPSVVAVILGSSSWIIAN